MLKKIQDFWNQKTLKDIFSTENIFRFLSAIGILFSLVAPIFPLQTRIILGVVFAIGLYITDKSNETKREKWSQDISNLNKLQEKYDILLNLNDILFKHHVKGIYELLKGTEDLRVSAYIYDRNKNKFLLLSRFSENENYNKMHPNKWYANAGWLNLTWSDRSSSYCQNLYGKTETAWARECQKENRMNCQIPNCQGRTKPGHCVFENRPDNCPMLSLEILKKKAMKAKSVYGVVLKDPMDAIGILLIETMEECSIKRFREIESKIEQGKQSLVDILIHIGDDLLKIKQPQIDIAENFSVEEKYGKSL